MKIQATLVNAIDLKPGDLFSAAGPEYWNNLGPSIGEKVYIRTNTAANLTPDADAQIYLIEIIKD